MKRYKFNVEIIIDTDEKVNNDLTDEELNNSFIEGFTELLNDELGDCCKINVNEDTKWQKLKEWLKEIKTSSEKQMKEARIDTDYYTRASVQNLAIERVLKQMLKLEGEDE